MSAIEKAGYLGKVSEQVGRHRRRGPAVHCLEQRLCVSSRIQVLIGMDVASSEFLTKDGELL